MDVGCDDRSLHESGRLPCRLSLRLILSLCCCVLFYGIIRQILHFSVQELYLMFFGIVRYLSTIDMCTMQSTTTWRLLKTKAPFSSSRPSSISMTISWSTLTTSTKWLHSTAPSSYLALCIKYSGLTYLLAHLPCIVR